MQEPERATVRAIRGSGRERIAIIRKHRTRDD
jgi:hypothetical protein